MLKKIALILLIIGGLNWGLVGLLDFDLVAFLLGGGSLLSRTVYTLVAVGAVISLPLLMVDNGISSEM